MIWAMLFAAAPEPLQKIMQSEAMQGMSARTREVFTSPGSNVARAAATDSWHAFYWVMPFILIAFVMLAIVIVKFRDHGDGRQPARFHEQNFLESLWTIVPIIVVVTVALQSYPVLHYMEFGGNNPDLNIDVIGHQWFWEYKYPQYGIDISNATLVLPADKVVDLDLTSVDVIHGFYVPGLGIQEDALPGRITNQWFKADAGYYKGQCTQLCGVNHDQMLIEVQVLPDQQWREWLQAHASSPAGAPPAVAGKTAALAMPGMQMGSATGAPQGAAAGAPKGGSQQ